MTTEPYRIPTAEPLRVDARNNRTRIVEAARELFAVQGLDVTMTDIARHSGVGVATLYRRYPTREALLEALTTRSFRMVLAVAREAADLGSTALVALDHFLDRTIDHGSELKHHRQEDQYNRKTHRLS